MPAFIVCGTFESDSQATNTAIQTNGRVRSRCAALCDPSCEALRGIIGIY